MTPVAPEPRPLPPLAGRWTHWNGTVFQIQMNGRAFSGAEPRGPRIEGALDNDWNATFVIRDAMGNVMYQAPAAQLVATGNGYHLVYEGGAQTLFVNENPHY